jgi:hypothetical protein
MYPRDGAAGGGDSPHQVVRGLTRRRDHQSFGGGLDAGEPFARSGDSLGSARTTDYLRRCMHLSPRIVSHFAAPAALVFRNWAQRVVSDFHRCRSDQKESLSVVGSSLPSREANSRATHPQVLMVV